METNKYEEALKQYNTALNDEAVKAKVERIISERLAENRTPETMKFLFNSIELTSLSCTDSDESILKMVEKVNSFDADHTDLGHVAAICVYPNFAKIVADSLEVDGVEITCVSGAFPSSQTFQEVKVAETALAVKDGATEIDIVLPVGQFLAGDYEGVADTISELKAICGEKSLKVILETGALKTAENIKKAAIIAMYAGADYIKTSTGKISPAATPEAAYVMCEAIKEYKEKTGIQIGFKPAGGMKTIDDALTYYTIVKEVLGNEWVNNKMFRLGTSSLANLIYKELTKDTENYF